MDNWHRMLRVLKATCKLLIPKTSGDEAARRLVQARHEYAQLTDELGRAMQSFANIQGHYWRVHGLTARLLVDGDLEKIESVEWSQDETKDWILVLPVVSRRQLLAERRNVKVLFKMAQRYLMRTTHRMDLWAAFHPQEHPIVYKEDLDRTMEILYAQLDEIVAKQDAARAATLQDSK